MVNSQFHSRSILFPRGTSSCIIGYFIHSKSETFRALALNLPVYESESTPEIPVYTLTHTNILRIL